MEGLTMNVEQELIRMRKHIEEVGESYIVEHGLDKKDYQIVQEFSSFDIKKDKPKDDDREGCWIKGYGSTFQNVDRTGDIISNEAFNKTIKGLKKLPILKDHYNSIDAQIGSWVTFSIDDKGLYLEGFISADEKSNHTIKLIQDKHLDTLSIGGLFKYKRNADGTLYKDEKNHFLVEDILLLEVSIVSVPANPKAIFTVKSFLTSENPERVANAKADPEVLNDEEKIKKYADEIYKKLQEVF